MTDSDALDIVMTPLDIGPDEVRASAALLSCEERRRASKFVLDRDRRRFVVARARLRELLAQRLDLSPAAIELEYGAGGKPRLAQRVGDPDLRFNVSHCGDVAAFAFTMGREVGIDVEAMRVLPDADAIAAWAFSRRENDAYRALASRERPLGFFNCWTRKEAFVKALGDGLRFPLDRFDVSLAPGEPARLLRVGRMRGNRSGWALHAFAPGPGLVGAIAVRTPAHGAGAAPRPVRIRARWLSRDLYTGTMKASHAA